MICAHCKTRDVNVAHVRACSQMGQSGSHKRDMPHFEVTPAPSLAVLSNTNADIEGVYFKDGVFFKVQVSANTGNAYAKRWGDTENVGDGGAWEYVGRKPLHHLTLADKVTAADAAKFGHITGQCVFCARKLTDERSIAVGYGPVCAEREGLPWGEPNNSHPEAGTLAQQRAMVEYEGL